MASTTVRDVTYDLLRQLKINTIFGNPGSTEEPFLKNFPADFHYVLALQEASAMAMADGYAQITGKAALVNLHTVGGLGNAMGNLVTAYQNKTPLIITAGQQVRKMLILEPWLTNVAATMTPQPWVKWAYEPARAQDIPTAFMQAVTKALQPPKGPVFLSLPADDWDQECDNIPAIRTFSERVAPDPARIKQFAEILNSAKSPMLIFGAGIARSGAWQEAQNFAQIIQAPVWVAPALGHAPFDETHPLFMGILPFAIDPLAKKLEGHDVVLVVGAPVFRYYPYVHGSYLPQGTHLLHISDDPAETARAAVGDSCIGDAKLALEALAELVKTRKHSGLPSRKKAGVKKSTDGALTPSQVFHALNEIRPESIILLQESLSNLKDLHEQWPITKPNSYFTCSSAILGWNLPASVGIALAQRDSGTNRPVILIIGDGSVQYSVQALWTAAQLNLPILIIVMRNYGYVILKAFSKFENNPGVPGLDLPDLDIVSIAKGYGCHAMHLDNLDEIKQASLEAWGKNKPTVIEIPITQEVPNLI